MVYGFFILEFFLFGLQIIGGYLVCWMDGLDMIFLFFVLNVIVYLMDYIGKIVLKYIYSYYMCIW